MKKGSYEEHIRLAVIVPYYLVHFPLLFRFLQPGNKEHWDINPGMPLIILLMACIFVYLVLELIEYLVFRYQEKKREITLIMTGIRFIAWFLPVIVTFLTPEFPILDLLIPFFVMSLYFVFPLRYSIIFLFGAVAYVIVIFLLREQHTTTRIAWFMLIPRTLNIFILYAFAHFWENARRNREKLTAWAEGVGHQVALEERTRLARDIHDNLGHYMTVIQIQLSKAEAFLDKDTGEVRNSIRYARESAREAMGEIRQSLDTLNNPDKGLDLKMEVTQLIEPLKRNGLTVTLDFKGDQEGCNYAVLLAIYRMVQEGVTNILKHSGATEVMVQIDLSGHARISDNGCGFPAAGSSDPEHRSLGLSGLINRFSLIQGRFTVHNSPEGGAVLEAEFPRDPVKTVRGVSE